MDTKLGNHTILAIGGAGFLGRHLIEDLIDRGAQPGRIHILDAKIAGHQVLDIRYHCADIASLQEVKEVLQLVTPSVVFHMVSPYPFETDRATLERVNVQGARNVIEGCQSVGSVAAFVHTSSSSVIHDHHHALRNADERFPVLYSPQQRNYYAHTKAVAETIVLSANRNVGPMLTTALRPSSMYGEGDTMQTPNLIKNARAGRANLQIGPGKPFDNTYVKNLTHAQILAAEALLEAAAIGPFPHDKRVDGEAFFVTDDDNYTFPAYARLVAAFAGYPVNAEDVRIIPLWLMLPLVYVVEWLYWIITFGKCMSFSTSVVRLLAQERTFNIDKAKARLGYRPRFTTSEGTKRAVEAFIDNEKGEQQSNRKKAD
jgi:sterol-4alpha-carboxylate 3-dehydrogenase (decarboxylating)